MSRKGKSKNLNTQRAKSVKVTNGAEQVLIDEISAFEEAKSIMTTNSLVEQNVQNSNLSEAILGYNFVGEGTQLSQTGTLFKNARWYLISNFRQLLSEIYIEFGLIQTIVDVPVEDALRGGIKIITDELDEDDIQELQAYMEQEDDMQTVAQALKWNRLFGGGGILTITDQKADTPLNLKAITEDSPLGFRAIDMWELFSDKQQADEFDDELQKHRTEHYQYYSKKVHKSRVMIMKGKEPPSFIRPRLRGWGLSCLEPLVRSVNQYLKATDLGFEVLDEFKLDIYKIKGFAASLTMKNGPQKIHERIQLGNQQKNYQNALAMDAEDDYQQKQLSFAGLAEAMDGIRKQVASDLRMPMTKLFGVSSAGFSSGQDDIENYNAMIESDVRAKAKFHIIRLVKLRCREKFGIDPEDLTIEFEPLRVLSAEQEETVKTQQFNRIHQARQSGEITSKEFKQACNSENLLLIKVDDTKDSLEAKVKTEEDVSERTVSAPSAPKSTMTAPETPQAKV